MRPITGRWTNFCAERAEDSFIRTKKEKAPHNRSASTFRIGLNGKAYASSDIAPADSVATSSYDVIKDKGPVLTFNTENGIMHFLAQPYQNDVDGEQGDYEFVIMRTTNDSIFDPLKSNSEYVQNILKFGSSISILRGPYCKTLVLP